MNVHALLLRDLIKRLGWRFPVLVAWTAAVGLGESISVILFLPLLSRIGIAAAGTQGASKHINDALLKLGANSTIEILFLVIVVITIQTAFSIRLNWWTARLASHYRAQRQIEMFRALLSAKWSFIADKKAAELTNAIITECERLGHAFNISMILLGNFVVAIVYVIFSLLIAWQVTLAFVALALAAAVAMKSLYAKSYTAGQSVAPVNANLQLAVNESFAAAKLIKASAGVDRAIEQVEPLVRKLENASALASAMPGTVRGILEYAALIGFAIILVLTSYGMGVAVGNVVIVMAMVGRLFPRLTTVQAQLHYLNANLHAIDVIHRLQTDADVAAERKGESSGTLAIAMPTSLVVRDLYVEFGGRAALEKINLTLPVPGLVALVGKSGAGKSTLLHTVLGLIEPSEGTIRLGTHDLATAPLSAWRRAIGYVPQETILFHASIRENLALAHPSISDAGIKIAAQRAHAYDFIQALPKGFDTIIGDQGVKLSGGQRQRLGIARALLGNPVLLLLDEAMSALDGESETEVLRTLEDLRNQVGILLVAHRLAAAKSADVICVFDAGRVVETGCWSELISRKKRLHALAEAQSLTANELPA